MKPLSPKVGRFTESVIRMMSQVCARHGGINLAQGFPDFEPPEVLKAAAKRAIDEGYNQYAVTWGSPAFRRAIAAKVSRQWDREIDPDRHVTVTCGATEAMIAALLALVEPGDEVVIFEPFYENYGPDAVLAGATPRYVPLREPDYGFDPDELRAAFSPRTKAVILNTPNNPVGRVFRREDLVRIAALAEEFDAYVVTDEIYEHIVYRGLPHVSIATLPGMFERTVTISGLSKTFSVTGWRLAYAIAPEPITGAIRKVHDFLTVGAAAPLQEAGAVALALPPAYYAELAAMYDRKRAMLLSILTEAGFRCHDPEGAYYIMTDIGHFGFPDDTAFALWLVEEIGVAAVPGSSFYADPASGRTKLRFTFAKKEETLARAGERLLALRARI
ncbi:MAG TPA: aminotransferase class I/II-fold pyridoxal phosphate-dependent enzyme [Thermodesulfobacteriota bacterium]|nr:aminotransferase class I/II-fold pyridoxal phosphate-dependent enzyme [Thermodesulfobacteriota bacterium]